MPAYAGVLLLTVCGPGKMADAPDSASGSLTDTTQTASSTSPGGLLDETTGSLDETGTTCDGECANSSDVSSSTEATPAPDCDSWWQNCPPGQKCSPYADDGGSAWNTHRCVDVMPDPKKPGEPCTIQGAPQDGIDDCDAGSMCESLSFDNKGLCVEFCKGAPDDPICTAEGAVCIVSAAGLLNLCYKSCSPLAKDCSPLEVCVQMGQLFVCVQDASGAEGQQHDPCAYSFDCDLGLHCVSSEAAVECNPNFNSCCQPFCDLSDPEAAAMCGGAGQKCVPYGNLPPPGIENLGMCTASF